MKAVLNETKRILAVMLSVAMIIAAVPQAAFAAPDGEVSEDAIQTEELATEAAPEEGLPFYPRRFCSRTIMITSYERDC